MQPVNIDILSRIRNAGLEPPKMLTLMITSGCNLHCHHCWLECQSSESANPVPADILRRLILEFAELGESQICLTGGEGLTHPNWFEILEFACQEPNYQAVCFQTNATLLSVDVVDMLNSLPLSKFKLQVSLDGATARTHDWVRGSGSFVAALKGIDLLRAGRLNAETTVAFTEMAHNYGDLPDLLEMMDTSGIGRLVTGTLVQGGRASQTDRVTPPRPSQVRTLLDRYQNDSRFRKTYDRIGNIAAIEWFKGRESVSGNVCTCIRNPFINAFGKMYPCLMFLNNAFAAGNVHHRPLLEVLSESISMWSKLPKISQKRTEALNACKACPGRSHCAGGCMGRAFACYGDMMTVEDRCDLRKVAYLQPLS